MCDSSGGGGGDCGSESVRSVATYVINGEGGKGWNSISSNGGINNMSFLFSALTLALIESSNTGHHNQLAASSSHINNNNEPAMMSNLAVIDGNITTSHSNLLWNHREDAGTTHNIFGEFLRTRSKFRSIE